MSDCCSVIQAVLGCLPIPDPSLHQEAMKIMRIADRVCKCLVAYTTRPSQCRQSKSFLAVLNSIILAKCVTAQLWENSPYVSKQLRGIGPTFSTLLASAGKVNFMLLEESHPRDLERIMNKGPPAGNIIRKQIGLLPKYQLTISPIDRDRINIQLSLLNQAHLSENMENLTAGVYHKSYIIVGDSENYLLYLTSFKDTDLIRVYGGTITREITRRHNYEHKIMAYCISSSIVGIDVNSEYLFIGTEPVYSMNSENVNIHEKVCEKGLTIETKHTNDRKRKMIKNVDVTCPKEKLKRENTILQKIRTLKESFGKCSKEFIGTLTETAEISAPNLTRQKCNTNNTESFDSNISKDTLTKQSSENTVTDSLIREDVVEPLEDEQVKNILNCIENEISNAVKQRNISLSTDHHTLSNLPNTLTYKKQANQTRLHKKNVKSNYNFIDLLEEKNDTNEVNHDITNDNVGGFVNTVKCQIDKYLENVENAKSSSINIEKFLATEKKEAAHVDVDNNNIVNDVPEEALINCTSTSGIQNEINVLKQPILIKDVNEESNKIETDETNQINVIEINEHDKNKNCNDYNENNSKYHHSFFKDAKNHNSNNTITTNDINKYVRNLTKDSLNNENNLIKQNMTGSNILNINDYYANEYLRVPHKRNDNPSNNTAEDSHNNDLPVEPSCSLVPYVGNINCATPSAVGIHKTNLKGLEENKMHIPIYSNHIKDTKLYNNTSNIDENFDFKQEEKQSTENFSFLASKFDICTDNKTNQTVKIITKLKIDLDVTKIVSATVEKANNNYTENNNHIEPVTDNSWAILPDCLHHTFQEYNIDTEHAIKAIEDEVHMNSKDLEELDTSGIDKQETTLNQSFTEKCKTVEDIVNKYSKIINSKSNTPTFPGVKQSNNIIIGKSPLEKPKRRYKISDIQNVEIPKICNLDNLKLDKLNYQGTEIDQNEFYSEHFNRDSQESKDFSACQFPIRTPTDTDYSSEFNTDLLIAESKQRINSKLTEDKFNINNALLNPKTLLQYIHCDDPDKDIPIPPPPQFADGVIYSPKQIHSIVNPYTPISPEFLETSFGTHRDTNKPIKKEEFSKNIFNSISQDKAFTISKNRQTYTLSRDENFQTYSNPLRKPITSLTEMRNNSPGSKVLCSNNTFNKFKFTPRNNCLRFKK